MNNSQAAKSISCGERKILRRTNCVLQEINTKIECLHISVASERECDYDRALIGGGEVDDMEKAKNTPSDRFSLMSDVTTLKICCAAALDPFLLLLSAAQQKVLQ